VNTKIVSTLLVSLVCALPALSVPPAASADDSGLRDWLRSRGGDGSDVGDRFRDWLRSRRDDGSDDRWEGVRDWLRARDDGDRDWWDGGDRDWPDWRRRFGDDGRFGDHRRGDRDDYDWWDRRDHRPAARWPYAWPWAAYDRYRYDDYYRRPYAYDRYDYGRYGRPYYYYDDHDRDDFDDVWPWLAFTAIAWKLLDNLNEDQQRQHEMALSRATAVPVGETVRWSSGEARGAVTPVREAPRGSGVYCREFRQEVMIGDREESAFGTACRMPDGTWRMEP
jgi:hypothetical protein